MSEETQRRVAIVERHGTITLAVFAKEAGIARDTACKWLKQAAKAKRIEDSGEGIYRAIGPSKSAA